MKKIVTIALSLILILSLAGCTGKKVEETNANKDKPAATNEQKPAEVKKEPTTVDKIKESGKLVMATSADYPPFESRDKDGKTVIGFDVDIAEAVAKKLGVKLEIKDMDFSGLLAALQQGKADIVAAGMSADEERKKSVDFSKGYFIDSFVLVVKEGDNTIKTAADMNGKKISTQLGSTCDKAAKTISGVQIKNMDKIDQVLLEVKNGRTNGAVVNLTAALGYLSDPNMKGLKVVEIPELNKTPDSYSIAVKKGDAELLKVIDGVIDELKASGEYDKLIKKWNLEIKK